MDGSQRSDSPGGSQCGIYSQGPSPIGSSGRGFVDVSRLSGCDSNQYGYDPPPPPPPPRSQGVSVPPPTPPRGTTPPPPPYPCPISTGGNNVSSMPPLLSRLSPGPGKGKGQSGYPMNSSSQSSTPQRGTSPVAPCGARAPVLVQNNAQVQQQLSQQMQAMAINSSGPNYCTQLDRPPPYPVGAQIKHMGGVKLGTPPPSYNCSVHNRHSPTHECRKSPAQLPPHPVSPSLSPTTAVAPQVVRGTGQTARQAKTPTPIIMQSVKSTQVQKPILQTAVAPTSPPGPSPPPSYASSIQEKQLTELPSHDLQSPGGSGGSSPSIYPPMCSVGNSVPTTDPPSYHSTMQAMAAARGYNYVQPSMASIPVQEIPVQQMDLASTPLAHIPISQVATVDSIITTQPCSSVEVVSSCSHGIGHQQLQRKFSPVMTMADTASSASRSESPVSSVTSHDAGDTHALSQSPISCLSTATSSPSTQSDMTLESGYSSSSQSARGMPPPPPLIEKTMHHSPIPERKKLNPDQEDQRDGIVKVYSSEAYKFFMEQHVENLIKAHEMRKHRRMQLEKEMKKIGLSSQDQSEMRKMLSQKESNYIRLKRAKMNKMMFQKIKTIGEFLR